MIGRAGTNDQQRGRSEPLIFERAIKHIEYAVLITLLLGGISYSLWRLRETDRLLREGLLQRVRLFAKGINIETVEALNGDASDAQKPEQQRLNRQLRILREANDDLRMIFLAIRKSDGRVVMVANSNDPGTTQAIAPGTAYPHVPDDLRGPMAFMREFTYGPLKDRWGSWLLAMAPVRDPFTGKVLLSIGASLSAKQWRRELLNASLPSLFLAFALMAIVMGGRQLLLRRQAMGRAAPAWQAHLDLWLIVAFGLILSAYVAWRSYAGERLNRQRVFEQLAMTQFEGYLKILSDIRSKDIAGLAQVIQHDGDITMDDFHAYAGHLAENPLVYAWAWVPALAHAERQAFEEQLRRNGLHEMGLWELAADGRRVPAPVRDYYYPFVYFQPWQRNVNAMGYNMGSNAERLLAIKTAAYSGLATATVPVPLVHDPDQKKSIMVFHPVYHADGSGRLRGYVVTAIRMETLLGRRYRHHDPLHVTFTLLHDSQQDEYLACTCGGGKVSHRVSRIRQPMFVFGKVFIFSAHPSPDFMSQYRSRRSPVVLFVGMVLTAAFTMIAGLAIRLSTGLEGMVTIRTRELSESERRYDELATQSQTVHWQLDEQGRFTYISPICTQVIGFTADELLGERSFYELFAPGFDQHEKRQVLAAIVHHEPITDLITPLQRRNGEVIKVSSTAAPSFAPDGRYLGYHGYSRDVSERECLLVELRASREAAQAASAAKGEFLASMSHEIRTPINGVIGMAELLGDTRLDDEQRHYVDVIGNSGRLLLMLINEILDFSRIEAGKVVMQDSRFAVADLIEDVADNLAPRAQQKGVEIVTVVDPALPLALRGDDLHLQQIVLNLAGNAVKFTDQGEIVIGIRLLQAADDGVVVCLSVRDTGIGIPEEQQQSLCNAFYQADASLQRRSGGTGLGLSIVKSLVELMDGRLSIRSKAGEGSEFSCEIPLKYALERNRPADALPEALFNLSVLVLVRNAVLRDEFVAELGGWGLKPEAVANLAAAQALLGQRLHGQAQWPVALLEIPRQDVEARDMLRQVKDDPRWRGIRCIALLELGGAIAVSDVKAHGFSDVLAKPIKRRELLNALLPSTERRVKRTLHSHDQVSPVAASLPVGAVVSSADCVADVLLAEDNVTNQQVAKAILCKLGHSVDIVDNGRAALERLAAGDYRVVLMDVQMPEMDGLTATRQIRDPASPVRNHAVPVIAMTAHALNDYQNECYAAGMDDYIAKPITPGQLRQVLSRWLS